MVDGTDDRTGNLIVIKYVFDFMYIFESLSDTKINFCSSYFLFKFFSLRDFSFFVMRHFEIFGIFRWISYWTPYRDPLQAGPIGIPY